MKHVNLFNFGEFTLHSGDRSNLLIDCRALSHSSLLSLARVSRISHGQLKGVLGIPWGGLRFANALREVNFIGAEGDWLLVDDVLSTGKSMIEAKTRIEKSNGYDGSPIKGLVIFARGPKPSWITAVIPDLLGIKGT